MEQDIAPHEVPVHCFPKPPVEAVKKSPEEASGCLARPQQQRRQSWRKRQRVKGRNERRNRNRHSKLIVQSPLNAADKGDR